MKLKKPVKNDVPYTPIACSRILQTLDCEKRFGVPYGSKSSFSFAFRDHEFRKAGNRSYKYYMKLRQCKTIKEYRQHVRELYQDSEIDIEVNGESKKFPIQMIPIPRESHKELKEIAIKNKFEQFPPLDVPLVFLSSLPVPRILASPPTGRYRNEFLTEMLTNKIIDFAVIVPEVEIDCGLKHIRLEISRCLASVEAIFAYAGEISKHLKNVAQKPLGISLRGTMADNPAIAEEAFRVPISCKNFWEHNDEYWPTLDIDLDFFCGAEDFDDIFKSFSEPSVFTDINAKVNGLMMTGETKQLEFLKEGIQKHIDIYIMTDEWVFTSLQRHLHLGLEQPWAYYYATSYPILFEDWGDFLDSLYNFII